MTNKRVETAQTGYETAYFGGVLGRVANRIANAAFTVDGVEYRVNANDGANQLHGGIKGWDKVVSCSPSQRTVR